MPRHRGIHGWNFFGSKLVSVESAAWLARSFYESLPDDIRMSPAIVVAIASSPSGQRRDLVGVIIAPAGAVQSTPRRSLFHRTNGMQHDFTGIRRRHGRSGAAMRI
jgi:hypothetical protein